MFDSMSETCEQNTVGENKCTEFSKLHFVIQTLSVKSVSNTN